jgi:hypothetical protein
MATRTFLTTTEASSMVPNPTEAATKVATRSWGVLAGVVLLAVAVFWAFEALPFQDLPAHAGLIALRNRIASSAAEQPYFVYAPHVGPYSLFRVLGSLFAHVVGPVGAVRALATLPVIAMPIAMVVARKRLHGEWSVAPGFLGVALSFGFTTVLGFASFQLGIALLIFALPSWLLHLSAPSKARDSIAFAALVLLLFIAHGHAFALFLLIALTTWLLKPTVQERSNAIDGARTMGAIAPLLPAMALAVAVFTWERLVPLPAGAARYSGNMSTLFQSAYDKFTLLITPTLMTRSGIDFTAGVLLWAWVIFTTIRAVARWLGGGLAVHERRCLAAAFTMLVVFLALPHNLGWFGFFDGRVAPLLILLPLVGVAPKRLGILRAWESRVMAAMALAIVVSALAASFHFQDEAKGFQKVLARIPAGVRILNIPLDPNSDAFTGHPFVHYDKLVMADRPAIPSDIWFHHGTGVYPTQANPSLHLPATYIESDLRDFDWKRYDLKDWDFVLVRTRPSHPAPTAPSQLTLLEHEGGWWLYQRRL